MSQQDLPEKVPAPGQPLIWALISSALLAAWIGWQLGWQAALAGVVGILIHEYGHVLAIDRAGCGPGRIHMVPFLGGVAVMQRPPRTEFDGALIALAGPSFGLLAAVPFYLAGLATGDAGWFRAAVLIAFINLVNLAPAPPLDGSRIVGPVLARIHPLVERGAMVLIGSVAIAWALMNRDYLFAGLIALGVVGAMRRGPQRPASEPLVRGQSLPVLGLYLGAVALCVLAMKISVDGLSGDVVAMLDLVR